MRKRTRLACVACAFTLLAATTGVGAQSLRPDQIRQNLFSQCMAPEGVGWVVGELGRIFRTDDGGQTWKRQDAGTKKPLLAASCIDGKTAWVGGKGALLYRTTDGGETWDLLTPNTTKHIFDIAFISRTHGIAVGDWGLLMYTTNGGEKWTLVGMPEDFVMSAMAEDIGLDSSDTILYATAFADATHGWVVGEFGTILVTTDGGRTWKQQQSPVETTLFGAYFENRERGWAVGMDAVILQTTDGGRTWRQVQAPLRERSLYDIGLSGQYGWIAGDSGTLLKTVDGGRTWNVEPLPIALAANWFRTVQLRSDGRGQIAGAEGLLFAVENDIVRNLRGEAAARVARRGPS